jgi:hypothetical protein
MTHVAESLRDSIGVSERRPHVVRSLRDRVASLGQTRPREFFITETNTP